MANIIRKILKGLLTRTGMAMNRYSRDIALKSLPKFGNSPKNLCILLPREITNPKAMFLGDDISFGPNCMLKAVFRYPGGSMKHPENRHRDQAFSPRIIIGNRVTATAGLQLTAMDLVEIQDDVMFASNVFVCDGQHGYSNVHEPYKYQGLNMISPVCIGKGCWIGQNTVIMPGVHVGEQSIVGANSVVTRSIPPRCIAAGAPARVIKAWSEKINEWTVPDRETSPELKHIVAKGA